MSEQPKLYGLDDWENLEDDLEHVVERIVEDACDCDAVGTSFDVIAAKLTWPLRVRVYRRMELPAAERLAQGMLERVLEDLDDEYADPEGDSTEPTPAMKEAALACAKVIRESYAPFCWSCEPTEEIVEVTQEEARDMFGEKPEKGPCNE